MFHLMHKWPILFWNIFSVISIDLSYNKWQIVFSTLLIITSVYNFYNTPNVVCAMEGKCDGSLSTVIKGLFIRVVASTCVISRLVIFLKGNNMLIQYKKNIEKFHLFKPMTKFETEVLKKVSFRIVILCLFFTVPVNSYRLWKMFMMLYRLDFTIFVFVFMYIQNMSMYCVETHFTFLCFILYQKFVGINKDLMALKIDTIVRNKYPFLMRVREKYGKNLNTVDYNRDVLQTLTAGHSMANFVEQLKIKHRVAREAVKNLNDLFGVQLGLSMCSLCLFSMFDLYYHIRGIMNPTKSNILIYGWILQYSVRFGSVTILAHLTSKQALKSKVLLTDISNRYLDKNTKEEIQLFLNQICSCAIEFTACDFFTLNTHLITSAIAAATTYLVILLQFN
ncbi:gustatory receptor for sugar taste 43a-like [Melanaphis sacchari]|uniref:gustatory receptor for sugar taste 43a-like n=1 Tax=Melanaphis sacchari TaxID=742174 RepID=UPI000DC14B08|nr:gustatory receptor for sugar taste 43a-like [Melanaphis sacchari]